MSPRNGTNGTDAPAILVRLAHQAEARGDIRAALILLNVSRLLQEALQPSQTASR